MRRLRPPAARASRRSSTGRSTRSRAAAEHGDTVDLVPTFAFPIPFLVICDLLGLPDEKRETFSTLATARFDVTGGGAGTVGAIGGSREFLLAEAARQRKDPGPGLIGQIIREHGDDINDFELGGLADGVFTGGLETSASMLALGTAVLLENRELWNRLVADPTQRRPDRRRAAPAALGGAGRLPALRQAGRRRGRASRSRRAPSCWPRCPAANRDPRSHGRATSSTSTARPARTSPSATASTAASVPSWPGWSCGWRSRRSPRRFPDMRLAVPTDDLEYRALSLVYGVESLPVRIR